METPRRGEALRKASQAKLAHYEIGYYLMVTESLGRPES